MRLRTRLTGWYLEGGTNLTSAVSCFCTRGCGDRRVQRVITEPWRVTGVGLQKCMKLFAAKEIAGKHHRVRGWDDIGFRGILEQKLRNHIGE